MENTKIIGHEASLCNDAMTKHATVQNGSFASAVNNNPTHNNRFGPTTSAPFGNMARGYRPLRCQNGEGEV